MGSSEDERFFLSSREYRLNTLKNWLFTGKALCTAEKLADDGFYKVPQSDEDVTQCFVCLKELEGWEPDDEPHTEHSKHSSACPFLNSKSYENMTFMEGLEMDLNRYNNYLSKEEKKITDGLEKEVNNRFKCLLDYLLQNLPKRSRKIKSSNISNVSTTSTRTKRRQNKEVDCSSIASDESVRSTRTRTRLKRV